MKLIYDCPMKRIKALDLFCGAGGLTRGLMDAGIDVVCGIDILSDAKNTYERNNEGVSYIRQDVSSLNSNDIKALLRNKNKNGARTMLAGCAPCQPFSLKNTSRRRSKDQRKTLSYDFAELVKNALPDFVFMENVPCLEYYEPDIIKYFIKVLNDNKYSYDFGIVNAVYYGVPQHRKRIILMASRVNNEVIIPRGDYGSAEKPFKTVRDAIGDLPRIDAGMTHSSLINHRAAGLSEINRRRMRATHKDGGNRISWDASLWLNCHKKTNGFKDTYARMYWDRPAPTLTTRFFAYSTGRYGHPDQDRAISLKEGALLQSFRDDYIFEPAGSLDSISKQIGNAVPPLMAKSFGKYMLSLS